MGIRALVKRWGKRNAESDPAPLNLSAPASHALAIDLASILHGNGTGAGLSTQMSDDQIRRAYFRWQFTAATGIAGDVMMNPWRVETSSIVDGETKWENAPEHRLAVTLEHANDFMTGAELLYWSVVECLLVGRSWWRVYYNSLNEPAEYWPLIGKVEPKIDEEGKITSWQQEISTKRGIKKDLHRPEDIVYLRLPRPGDMYGGYGPGQAASSSVQLDKQIVESEWAAFKQGIFPFAIVKLPNTGTPEARREIMDEFKEHYAGAQKTGESIGVGKDQDVVFPPTRVRDMGYTQGSTQVRDEILGTYRYPAALAGLSKDVNRASAEALEYIYAKHTLSPLMHLFYSRIRQDLAYRFWSRDEVRLVYDDPVPADREREQSKRESDLKQGVISIDDARAEDGRAALHDDLGKVPLVDGTRRRLDEISLSATLPPNGTQGAQIGSRQTLAGRVKRRMLSTEWIATKRIVQDQYERMLKTYFRDLRDETLAAWDKMIEDGSDPVEQTALGNRKHSSAKHAAATVWALDAISGCADDQEHAILRKAFDKLQLRGPVDYILGIDVMAQKLAKSAAPINRGGLVIGGDYQASVLGNPDAYDAWGDDADVVNAYASQYGPQHYYEICGTTRRQMVDVVAAGIKEHATFDEMRLSIVDTFGAMEESRVANIAVTESTRICNAGGQAFREMFGIKSKQWITTFVNSRQTHMDVDGDIIPADAWFSVGGDTMQYPGGGSSPEENCWCNCVAIPIVKIRR